MKPGAALVTGAATRIGRDIALDLAGQGWRVAIHFHRSAEAAHATVEALRAAGAPTAVAVNADLTQEAEMIGLVDDAAAALGAPLTMLVNNASIFERDELETATRESWHRHLAANLRAPFVLTQDFAKQCPPALVAERNEPLPSGLIVNMLDQRVWKLTPHFMSYTVSKMGLWTLTRTTAQSLAPRIRVNAIGPGPTLINPRQSDAHFQRQREGTLLKRGADPSDVCAAIRYLISANAVTGQMIAVDGGQHLGWETPDIVGPQL